MNSYLENEFEIQVKLFELPAPIREYRFCERKWRFDFAWPEIKLALEIEGGKWINGRRTRPQGFAADLEKYNTATLLGWRILRVDAEMIANGSAIQLVEKTIKDIG